MNTIDLDLRFNWHPFTPIDSWLDPSFQPVSIAEAKGTVLRDESGREYLDGNSSIWTITHGHCHPKLVEAISRQLNTLDHSSFLGLTHPWSARLAEQLSEMAGGGYRVFYSDDGSTAMEAAIKVVWQFFQQNRQAQRKVILSLQQGYHGDTVGAMSLGHSGGFHGVFAPLLFSTEEVMAPNCFRCPYNKASFQTAEARVSRRCQFECAQKMEEAIDRHGANLAAVVLETRIQGAAGMWMHPDGYLKRISEAVRRVGAKLIVDEVFTGFGRTGKMLASEHDDVCADCVALGKGLTGGVLPMGATLVKDEIFQGFRGSLERTFFHGHSYTANPVGCAAALANLEVFKEESTLARIAVLSRQMAQLSQSFWGHPNVGDVRQEGLVLAIELVRNRETMDPFPWKDRVAYRISEKARDYGLLTRGIVNVLVLVPPFGTTDEQLIKMISALRQALDDVLT